MNLAEATVIHNRVVKPFETRVASAELRARIEKFQRILKGKRLKSRKVNVYKQ